MARCSRCGEQEHGRVEIFLRSHQFLLIMKLLWIYRTRPFYPSIELNYRTPLQLCPGPKMLSQVSVRQMMLQSLISRWKLNLALNSSSFFSRDWTLERRMLGRGGLWALFLSLLRIPARFLIRCLWELFDLPLFSSAFWSISGGHAELKDKVSRNRSVKQFTMFKYKWSVQMILCAKRESKSK